jgi:phytoene synthase
MRKLLWKQAVRARDAYAQGRQLVHEVTRRFSLPLKRYWLGGLEYLNEIERRDYDVWSVPIAFTRRQRAMIHTLARLGRLSFKSR